MKLNFPSPYTVLMGVIVIAAIATWILPSGQYSTIEFNQDSSTFELTSDTGIETLEGSQATLDELGILIEFEKFENGDLSRPISVPGTYQTVDKNPQGLLAVFLAPIKGMYAVIDIVMLVLIIGGFIGVFNSTGALDEGVSFLATKLKGRESLLIIIVTTLIAIGGTTFGMAEETLAFYPILVPIFLAAGYDLMVPVAVIFIGSCMGTMASTINPFATIIASDAAGINWTIGFSSRLAMLILGTTACIAYIVRYANRAKADPTKSILYGLNIHSPFKEIETAEVNKLELKTLFLLILFGGTFLVMIMGVAFMHWWLEEMTVLFLISAVLMGFLMRIPEKTFISRFVDGAKDLLGVSLIIGIARGVTIILNEGKVSDTILYQSVQLVEGTSGFLFLPMLLVVFFVMAFFISSTSGLAVLTMPIMSSLGQIIGVPIEEIVNAYLFGMGMMLFLTPANLILPSLAMVNLNYDSWIKFIWPLILILAVLSIGILWVGLLI